MLAQEDTSPPDGSAFSLLAAADLQDDLMVASNDLDRLQRLLSDACDSLMGHFYGANGELRTLLHEAAVQPEDHAVSRHGVPVGQPHVTPSAQLRRPPGQPDHG
jgi:hypothetical protein